MKVVRRDGIDRLVVARYAPDVSEGLHHRVPSTWRQRRSRAVMWIERLLRTIDRVQQQHTVLGFPVGVAKKFGEDQGGTHAALLAYYGSPNSASR